MRYRVLFSLFLMLAIVGGALPLDAATSTVPSTNYHYVRLFYYRDGPLATQSFESHASSIDVFAPQDYAINPDGSLSGSVSSDLLSFAKSHKIKVMPLVTNGSFSRANSKAFLGDSKKETAAINALVKEANSKGYWGWQFDFEQMDASDRDLYTAFIQRAYGAFKAHGLKLSVAVVAQISANPNDYKAGLWDSIIGVYDYSGLAANADFISVMDYDDPASKGPVAPYPWFQQVLTWSIAHIPNNKISLGIPLYYWLWNDATGKLVQIGGNEGIDNVFKNHATTLTSTYDPVQKEQVLHYTNAGVKYTLWYDNAQSVAAKIALVTQNRLYGASFWVLGLEVPSIYSSIKE